MLVDVCIHHSYRALLRSVVDDRAVLRPSQYTMRYREFRQMGGFGGMLENDPTATRLVLMDSYGIGHTISVVRPIIGPMLRPLCSKNT